MIKQQYTQPVLFALISLSLIACDTEDQEALLEGGNRAGDQAGSELMGALMLNSAGDQAEDGSAHGGGHGGAYGGGHGGAYGGGVDEICRIENTLSQDLLPELRSTQIHPDAVWDGEAFWITWTLPNDENKFEIWAGRFSCTLEPLIAPFALDQTPGMNDTDSAIAVQGDEVLVAWMRDNGYAEGATYNLSTRLQRLHRSTGERIGEQRALALSIDGTPKEGNLWMPDLVSSPEGGYLLVASWGNPEVNSFQIVMIPLALDGVEGEGWLMDPNGRDQSTPVISQYGQVFDVLWSGKGGNESEGFWLKTWRLNEGQWSSDPLVDLSARDWMSAAVSRGVNQSFEEALNPSTEAQAGAPYLMGSTQRGALELITASGMEGVAGPSGMISLGPSFGRRLIASYERVTATQSKVWWRAVNPSGSLEPVTYFQQNSPAAPYPLSITPFPGGHLALWAQGMNPAFMLKATLLATP